MTPAAGAGAPPDRTDAAVREVAAAIGPAGAGPTAAESAGLLADLRGLVDSLMERAVADHTRTPSAAAT